MKLALLSDIHANIHALEACLAHARDHGATRFALLGDLVGYGADPEAVMERVLVLAADGALVIKGNHDELAVSPPRQAITVGESTAAWTHGRLSPAHREFLDALPLVAQDDSVLLVHASVDAPELWHYVYDQRAAGLSLAAASKIPEVRFVFGGHVHMQTLYYRDDGPTLTRITPMPGLPIALPPKGQLLGTIGSVGQPRDGDPRAMYALLDTDGHELTFHRVPYDHEGAAAAIRAAGLPIFFADRLCIGR
jgi:diadenosine tetraphosphatase ApaH/serine/threonine PP2A family protein phosphatase